MDGSFLFAAALLPVVFVPVLRRCTWRTAAALALVCATVTAMGSMMSWSEHRIEPAAAAASGAPLALRGAWSTAGGPGTGEVLGKLVLLLGSVATLLAFVLVRRPDVDSPASGREPALASAVLLAIGGACALFDVSRLALRKPTPGPDGDLLIISPGVGLELTLLAAVTGTACAARAYVLLRRAFRGAQAEQEQQEVF